MRTQTNPGAGGGLMSLISPLYPRGPIDVSERVRGLQASGEIPNLPGWEPAAHAGSHGWSCESVEKLTALHPKILTPGHGQPMAGPEVEAALQQLAVNFDAVARPA